VDAHCHPVAQLGREFLSAFAYRILFEAMDTAVKLDYVEEVQMADVIASQRTLYRAREMLRERPLLQLFNADEVTPRNHRSDFRRLTPISKTAMSCWRQF